jgi:hypothetical protein
VEGRYETSAAYDGERWVASITRDWDQNEQRWEWRARWWGDRDGPPVRSTLSLGPDPAELPGCWASPEEAQAAVEARHRAL